MKPATIHEWRLEGRLYTELIAAYKNADTELNYTHFEWLCRHPEVVDPDTDGSAIDKRMDGVMQVVWTHMGGADTTSEADMMKKSNQAVKN